MTVFFCFWDIAFLPAETTLYPPSLLALSLNTTQYTLLVLFRNLYILVKEIDKGIFRIFLYYRLEVKL